MITELATTQIVAMNVAYLSSGIKVTGCHVSDENVGNEADSSNECCLLGYKGLWLPCQR
jgi:hypothetical protein